MAGGPGEGDCEGGQLASWGELKSICLPSCTFYSRRCTYKGVLKATAEENKKGGMQSDFFAVPAAEGPFNWHSAPGQSGGRFVIFACSRRGVSKVYGES